MGPDAFGDGAYTGNRNISRQAQDSRLMQSSQGMIEPGNIDLSKRPIVRNADGSISTVRSIGVNIDNKEYLLPTVSDDGRIMGDDEAIDTFRRAGKHLGVFKSPEASDAYAQTLHQQQDAMYSGRK